MHDFSPKFLDLLRALADEGVEHIVVGGVAAVLLGAPVTTFDLDIVHRREPENLDRLNRALRAMNAHYRGRPGDRLEPEIRHLATPGHQLLMSRFGPIDLLGTIDNGRDYDELIDHVDVLELDGLRIQVLDLETLIGIKERVGRLKDQAMLPVLRETLELSKKKPR